MHPVTQPHHIGALLRARRKMLKLSQTAVATRLALSQNRLSELESNPGTLTVAQLMRLASVLDLDVHITERTPPRLKTGGS
jgi:HTH-type transcriptional regulator/antitoxin HipB